MEAAQRRRDFELPLGIDADFRPVIGQLNRRRIDPRRNHEGLFQLVSRALISQINARPDVFIEQAAVRGKSGLPVLARAFEVAENRRRRLRPDGLHIGIRVHEFQLDSPARDLALRSIFAGPAGRGQREDETLAGEVDRFIAPLDVIFNARVSLPLVFNEIKRQPPESGK